MHVGRHKAPSPEMNWGADSSSAIILERRLLGHHPLTLIAEILFNIILDDIDQEIEVRLPKLKYARYQDEIFIPIYQKEKEQSYYKALNEILNKCYLLSPTLERAVRGGEPIPFSGGFILINNDGKTKIEYAG
ncbi:hypothetical protein FNV43_RR08323 [Rhamnella rubrinervis]|uniref:Uncharacterized protein n=1 Tax=Rhamnella rubrinervis TaxID=2594499 RepID=A0A8K0MNU3_9ROSA|nr:hypothetical protein FNV43_RR08323 [Rhamnella rubrinervis]